jgi:hypothetical protein
VKATQVKLRCELPEVSGFAVGCAESPNKQVDSRYQVLVFAVAQASVLAPFDQATAQ